MQKMVDDKGLGWVIDSAGTQGSHAGESADKRSAAEAKKRGYDLSKHEARKFEFADFYEFDQILAMDKTHLNYLEEHIPPNAKAEIKMFLPQDVPDPYYGGTQGFEKVLDMIEKGCNELI